MQRLVVQVLPEIAQGYTFPSSVKSDGTTQFSQGHIAHTLQKIHSVVCNGLDSLGHSG